MHGDKAQVTQELTRAVLHCIGHPHHSSAYPLPRHPGSVATFSPGATLTELPFYK